MISKICGFVLSVLVFFRFRVFVLRFRAIGPSFFRFCAFGPSTRAFCVSFLMRDLGGELF